MSTSNVVTHPRFAAVPVKNPPTRKGPKPKSCASFYAARVKRDRERRLRERENAVFVCGHCGAPKDNCGCSGPPRTIPNPATFTKRFQRFLDVLLTSDIAPETLARLRNAFCDD